MRLGLTHEGRATSVVDEDTGELVQGPFSSPEVATHWIADNEERLQRNEQYRQQAAARAKEQQSGTAGNESD